jgi:TusA-related sulfurtransferase
MGKELAHDHDDMADCPMKAEHSAGVDDRGDKGMGFSHTKTTHHFRMMNDGGAIEVTANDATDHTSRDQIRGHLAHIAKLFGQGNFEIPMFVHDKMPAGAAVMEQMESKITYRYEEMVTGGRVRITATDPQALNAVHDFLRFQIQEHRTGDTQKVE